MADGDDDLGRIGFYPRNGNGGRRVNLVLVSIGTALTGLTVALGLMGYVASQARDIAANTGAITALAQRFEDERRTDTDSWQQEHTYDAEIRGALEKIRNTLTDLLQHGVTSQQYDALRQAVDSYRDQITQLSVRQNQVFQRLDGIEHDNKERDKFDNEHEQRIRLLEQGLPHRAPP